MQMMKKQVIAVTAALVLAAPAWALSPRAKPHPSANANEAAMPANAASEASVRELLKVMQVEQQMTATQQMLEPMMANMMKQISEMDGDSTSKQAVMADMAKELAQAMAPLSDWRQLEPDMVRVYRRALTEDNVRAMTAFYRTPAGQELVSKTPELMMGAMEVSQARMKEVMPEVKKVMERAIARMQAEGERPQNAAPAEGAKSSKD